MLELYKKGYRRKDFLRMGYKSWTYATFLNETRDERVSLGLAQRRKEDTRYKVSPGEPAVLSLAKQGYAIGDIALALDITLDECRKIYNQCKGKYVRVKVR